MELHRFQPRLLDSLRRYDRQRLWHDVGAGATVGIVALPLAMAFAIASGVKPEQGLITAIVAGFLISALGGSSVQIGGPAGALSAHASKYVRCPTMTSRSGSPGGGSG